MRPDNVWDVDCSRIIPDGANNVHSAYSYHREPYDLMRQILRGKDRLIIEQAFEGLRPTG